VQRRRFLHKLALARITPEEVRNRLEGGESLFIVDLRAGLPGVERHSGSHPHYAGRTRLARPGVAARPRDYSVLQLTNEATSAGVALLLKAQGITRVRPVRGGAEAWERLATGE
jgi:rhodanese-related sulfurtransferase